MNKKKMPSHLAGREHPPTPLPSKMAKFPDYYDETLPNGFRVLVIEHHALPIISLRLLIRTGSFFDGDIPGLASMTGDLLTKGTATRSAKQIADEIDFVGGQIASGSDWDASYITINILKKHLPVGFTMMEDVVMNPTFAVDEVERIREQRLAMLTQRKDDPAYLADRTFANAVFGNYPYGAPAFGTEISLQAISRNDTESFHKKFYSPHNAILAIVGDIQRDDAVRMARELFEKWEKKDLPPFLPPQFVPSDKIKIIVVDKPGAVQSAIRVGHVGIKRNNPDYIPVYFLNTLFGGYFQSRINQSLREKHGFTYGASSTFDARIHPGAFSVSADVRNEVTGAAIFEIIIEMNRIREEIVSDAELATVKSYLVGSFPLQIETPSQIASRALGIELYGLSRNYYSTFTEKISQVNAEDLQRCAQQYLQPSSAAIVISGNAKEIVSPLRKFGSVSIIDADGRIIG